jgi:hypothetical protein
MIKALALSRLFTIPFSTKSLSKRSFLIISLKIELDPLNRVGQKMAEFIWG